MLEFIQMPQGNTPAERVQWLRRKSRSILRQSLIAVCIVTTCTLLLWDMIFGLSMSIPLSAFLPIEIEWRFSRWWGILLGPLMGLIIYPVSLSGNESYGSGRAKKGDPIDFSFIATGPLVAGVLSGVCLEFGLFLLWVIGLSLGGMAAIVFWGGVLVVLPSLAVWGLAILVTRSLQLLAFRRDVGM